MIFYGWGIAATCSSIALLDSLNVNTVDTIQTIQITPECLLVLQFKIQTMHLQLTSTHLIKRQDITPLTCVDLFHIYYQQCTTLFDKMYGALKNHFKALSLLVLLVGSFSSIGYGSFVVHKGNSGYESTLNEILKECNHLPVCSIPIPEYLDINNKLEVLLMIDKVSGEPTGKLATFMRSLLENNQFPHCSVNSNDLDTCNSMSSTSSICIVINKGTGGTRKEIIQNCQSDHQLAKLKRKKSKLWIIGIVFGCLGVLVSLIMSCNAGN